MHRTFPLLMPLAAACFCFSLAGCAEAHTGPEIAEVFNRGLAAYDAGQYQDAFKIWQDLQFEDVAAMRNLAIMLRKGQGVARDPKQAEEFFLRAAEAGLPAAQADLADMLLKGEAGPPDLATALPYLKAAAVAGHAGAQYQLGEFYETGAPPLIPRNLEVARQLYAAASRHGLKQAAARAAMLGPPSAIGATASGAPRPAPFSATQQAKNSPTSAQPIASAPIVAPAMATPGRPGAGPAPAPVTVAAALMPARSGAYVLQIGAYQSQANAEIGWKTYKAKYAALLSGYSSDVKRVELPEKGTWYRLRIASFSDRALASALCDRLKSDGSDCILSKQ